MDPLPMVATSFWQRLSAWLGCSSAARRRQRRRLGLSLGLGLGLLWFSPTALLAQTRLPPPPPVGPALDTPAAEALLRDGALPLPQDSLRTPSSALQPSEALPLEAGTRTGVGREIVIEPAKVTETQPGGEVPLVLVERSSGRRLLLLPGEELRIENPSLPQTPEPPPLTSAPAKEQLLYPLPHPVPITSGFGLRLHPLRGQPEFHAGVDLGASLGTPILASLSGRVVSAGSLGDLGITVVLEHAGGQRTRYGHMSRVAVTPGEVVKQGSIIGYVGATGAVTGPHLHFELWQRTAGQGWMVLDATEELKVALSRLPS